MYLSAVLSYVIFFCVPRFFDWGYLMDYMQLMAQADELSLRGLGMTAPNPIVGALLIDSQGLIIAQEFHNSGLHAEAKAINSLEQIPSGSTLITTLEPCNHQGKTAPCSDLIIKSGIKKVVYAVTDSNDLAKGGAEKLAKAGVEVVAGILKEQVTFTNRFWLNKIRNSRPYFIWKVAMSLDAKIAAADGTSKWITGEAAREDVAILRAQSDLILIGTGTALADNPSLNTSVNSARQPKRLVMGKRPIPTDFKLNDKSATTYFLKSNDISELITYLNKLEVNQVLVEAGANLGTALLKHGVIDEVQIYMAPSILGSGQSFVENLQINSLSERINYKIINTKMIDNDLKITLVRGI